MDPTETHANAPAPAPTLRVLGGLVALELLLLITALAFPWDEGAVRWRLKGVAGLPLGEAGRWGPHVLALAVLYAAAGVVAWRASARRSPLAVGLVAVLALQLGTLVMLPGGPVRWGKAVASPQGFSMYTDAVQPNLGQVLDAYPEEIRRYADPSVRSDQVRLHNHTATKPPGFLILLAPFGRLGSWGPTLLAFLIVGVYALGLFPLRALMREVGDEPGFRLASLVYALMPGPLIHAPALDLIYAPIVLLLVLCVVRALERREFRWAVLGGLSLSLALCLTYVPLTWLAILTVPVLARARSCGLASTAKLSAVFLVLIPLAPLLLASAFPWGLVEAFEASRATSAWISHALGRHGHYLFWTVGNLVETLQGYGAALLYLA